MAGEHGFRFFPAYYLHIWDLFQRIPVYQLHRAGGRQRSAGHPTSRTVMDNVRRVVTQGTTVEGKPSLVFPREAPRSPAEFLTAASQLTKLGFTPADVTDLREQAGALPRHQPAASRVRTAEHVRLRLLHRARRATVTRRFFYSPASKRSCCEMPRVLAAFDSRWGDARTNLTTYLQLHLQMDRRDNKADGVLNGPTTESWFDHWYRHLFELGVRFVHAEVDRLDPPVVRPASAASPPTPGAESRSPTARGWLRTTSSSPSTRPRPKRSRRRCAPPAPAAPSPDWTVSPPPFLHPTDRCSPTRRGASGRRDPYAMDEMGGFRGTGSRHWAASSTTSTRSSSCSEGICITRGQSGRCRRSTSTACGRSDRSWTATATSRCCRSISVISTPPPGTYWTSPDAARPPATARPTRSRQRCGARSSVPSRAMLTTSPKRLLPWPVWYALDRGLIMSGGTGQGAGRPVRNETPYLVPIVGDWPNRPGSRPLESTRYVLDYPTALTRWLEDLEQRNVWQARHGGYQVHNNSVVFAGTWTKTFTRMTSMEAACESGRHAVNAILDHFIWVESGGADRRENTTLDWRFPYGFLDQGLSSPVRHAVTGRRLLLRLRHREPGAARHPSAA